MRHELMQQALDQLTNETRSKAKEYINMKERLTWVHTEPTFKNYETFKNDYFLIVRKFDTYVMHFDLSVGDLKVDTTANDDRYDKLTELANLLFESELVKPRN